MVDTTVTARDGTTLAVRDHGGDGPDLLLLHGAGSHLESLERLVAELSTYRVVTTDQRWSGQSGDAGAYSWELLVDDVEDVIAALGLHDPVVGGHSWGGMIGAHYGARHPDAPAVFNLDGQGPGDPSLYDGLTAEEVEEARTWQATFPDWYGTEGDAEWRREAMAHARQLALAMRVAGEEADRWAARDLVEVAPGRWRRHPHPTLFSGLAADQRMFDLYRRVECPALVVLASSTYGMPEPHAEAMAAYRRGLSRAYAELADERPNIRVVDLPDVTHHGLAGRNARDAAAAVRQFLAGL